MAGRGGRLPLWLYLLISSEERVPFGSTRIGGDYDCIFVVDLFPDVV